MSSSGNTDGNPAEIDQYHDDVAALLVASEELRTLGEKEEDPERRIKLLLTAGYLYGMAGRLMPAGPR